MRNIFYSLFFVVFLMSCGEDPMPKPKGYLALQYPDKSYVKSELARPYSFEVLQSTNQVDLPKKWMKIEYPQLKASIDITYRPVTDTNLKELLMEAEKLVFEHTVKADQISSKSFEDFDKKTYGKLFEISGNAASQIQFHVTDSTHHFLKGSLFFYTKPNYDSILPAVDYIKKDMIKMMETLEWGNKKTRD